MKHNENTIPLGTLFTPNVKVSPNSPAIHTLVNTPDRVVDPNANPPCMENGGVIFVSPGLPAHNGTATSIAAAKAVRVKINGTHARILALFAAPKWREQGLTQADVHELTGISRQTLCPRFSELEKAGNIRKTDRTRSSVGTRDCTVYELCERNGAA